MKVPPNPYQTLSDYRKDYCFKRNEITPETNITLNVNYNLKNKNMK